MRTSLLHLLFLTIFSWSISLSGQSIRHPVSAIYTQLNSYSTQAGDVFSFTSNQAALATIKDISAGIYGERRFMVEDLGLYQAAVVFPSTGGGFGFRATHFGTINYNESMLGLAYGRNIGKTDIGLQFNYYRFKAATYGSLVAVNFEAGAIYHVTKEFETGIHIYNPTGTFIGKSGSERLPASYSAGFGYDASEQLYLGAELEKTEDLPPNINAGIQYRFNEILFARVGISSANSSFYFGIGVWIKDLRLDATTSVHPYLGLTPGLSLIYSSIKH